MISMNRELWIAAVAALFAFLLILLMASPGKAGEDCTDGTDCLADCLGIYGNPPGADVAINDPGGPNHNLMAGNAACAAKRGGDGIPLRTTSVGGVGRVVFVEDFEDTLFQCVTNAAGCWNDRGTAFPGEDMRATGSLWSARYGLGTQDCTWEEGYPANSQCSAPGNPYPCCTGSGTGSCPQYSPTCDTSTNNDCYMAEWTLGAEMFPTQNSNPCNDDSIGPCIDIFGGSTSFNDESNALGVPDCPGNDGLPGTGDDVSSCHNGDGVFDGHQALRYRNPANGGTGGIAGYNDPDHQGPTRQAFGALTDIGITVAYVYPDNQATSNVHTTFWKHEEFGDTAHNVLEYWFNGGSQGTFPFGGYIFSKNATNANANALAATSCAVGSFQANNPPSSSNAANIHASFNQSTQFPHGKWSCLQGRIEGMGTTTTRMRKWLNGNVVFDCTYDGLNLQWAQDYEMFVWGNYANRASDNPTCTGASVNQLSGRGVDNYVITEGAPVSCAEIGGVGGELGEDVPKPHRKGGSGSGSMRGGAALIDSVEDWLAYARERVAR